MSDEERIDMVKAPPISSDFMIRCCYMRLTVPDIILFQFNYSFLRKRTLRITLKRLLKNYLHKNKIK